MELSTLLVDDDLSLVTVHAATRRVCAALGFSHFDQMRVTTAVGEIARNIYERAGRGTITLNLTERGDRRGLQIVAEDHGPGTVPPAVTSADTATSGLASTGLANLEREDELAVGLEGAKALIGEFEVASGPNAERRLTLVMWLPSSVSGVEAASAALQDLPKPSHAALLNELQTQNQDLLGLLQELITAKKRQEQLNKELQETNLGVVVLNAELEEKARLIQRSEAALRARNDDLKGFAYSVSHDLKAPLRGIVGYAQELERDTMDSLGARPQFCISQILQAGLHLDQLIDDLLRYSRLDSELPAPSDVDVPALVQSILTDRSPAILEQAVEVSVAIAFTQARLWERGLHQVLANVIDNALKYSRQAHPPRLTIRGEETPDSFRLSVADNGIGFDPRHQERIFGLFTRLTQAADFEGTGIGLAIVKKLIDKLGGKIRAESAPGQGATFYIELPKLPTTP